MSENTTPAICGQAMCGQTICGQIIKTLTSIQIINPPTKRIYIVDEYFNKTDMVVKAFYEDGTSKKLNDGEYTCSPSYLGLDDTVVTISYTENNITKTASQAVYVTRTGYSDKPLTNELTRAGTGILDTYTKNIQFIHGDITADTLELPFSVSHIYNAKDAAENDAYCGFGWKTNFHQRIVSPISADDSDSEYIFIDGNGNRNKIIRSYDDNDNTIYVLDENQSTKYEPSARTLTDKNGNKSTFNSSGWLIEQLSSDGYRISVAYSSAGKISNVYEGTSSSYNKKFSFTYPNSTRMSISFSSKDDMRTNTVHYEFSANRLTKIYYETYGGSEYTAFSYNSIGILESVQDPIGHALSYSCIGKTVTVTETPGIVIKHSDITASISGASSETKVWTLRYGGNTRVTKDGKTTVLGFSCKNKYAYSFTDNSDGNDVTKLNVTDDLEIIQTIDVKPGQESYENILTGITKKGGSVKASIAKMCPNLVSNFNYDLSGNLNVHNPQESSAAYVKGNNSTMIGAYIAHFSFNRFFATANVAAKKGYVVSGFVKPNPLSFNCEMAVILYDANNNIVDEGVWEFNHKNPEWQAGAVCLDNPNLDGVKIKIMITSSNSNDSWSPMYVDNLRVVESTFEKSAAIEDNPNTTGYYESQRQTFGTGAYNETRYKIVNKTVKTHLEKRVYVDEFGNTATSNYKYDKNNGKLLSKDENGINNVYAYDGYMGAMSEHKRSKGSKNTVDQSTFELIESGNSVNHIQTESWSGNTVETNLSTALVRKNGDADGNKTIFGYYTNGDISSMTLSPAIIDGNSYYYTKFLLTKVVSGNNTIHYIYDGFGQLLQVRLNGALVKQYAYRDNCDYTSVSSENIYNYEEQTIPNGSNGTYSQKIIYNKDGMPLKKQEKTDNGNYSDIVTMNYAVSDSGGYKTGELKSFTDSTSGSNLTQTLTYDSATRQVNKITYSGARSGSISSTMSKGGKQTGKNVEFSDTINYNYYYAPNYIITTSAPVGQCQYMSCQTDSGTWFGTSDYTSFENLSGRTIHYLTERGSYVIVKDIFVHLADYKTIHEVIHITGNEIWVTERYEYDNRKNISEYSDAIWKQHSYKYDEAGRLIRENNEALEFTKVYTYNGGNIKTVTTYGYTTEDTPTGGTTQTYNYKNGTDKLSSITGSVNYSDDISYDLAGNPLQWKGNVLQWNRGRRLTCYGDSSYTYDAGGIRQSKTIGTEIHTYYTEDSRIHKEEYRGRKLLYGYDESGIATIECNGEIYYMQKNIQGDIVGLVDGTKKVVAKYVYDAWGNHKLYDANNNEDTNANFIGNINPFRYRGYYYDSETGLYYLQTRYYDPSIGRFLSADSVDYADPESFNGLNFYSYCWNNPVNMIDSFGYYPVSITSRHGLIGSKYGGGIVYPGGGISSKLDNRMPEWLKIYAFYGEVSFLKNASLIGAEVGVTKFGFKTPKLFSKMDPNSILNPNLYLEIGAMTAKGNIGAGISGQISFASISGSVELGNSISIKGTLYAGVNFAVDFSNGIKIGFGFWEVSVEFSWIDFWNWLTGRS